jgi:hypothetical protein
MQSTHGGARAQGRKHFDSPQPQQATQDAATPAGTRRTQNVAAIKIILQDRHQPFGDAMAMKREELATLNCINRMIALKHGLLNGMAEAARQNPNSDILPSLLAYIAVLAEASEIGACTYNAARVADFFDRSENSICTALARGEAQRLIIRGKAPNGQTAYWPFVLRELVTTEFSQHHIVEAYAPPRRSRGRPRKDENNSSQGGGFNKSSNPDAKIVQYGLECRSTSPGLPTYASEETPHCNWVRENDDGADATHVIPFPQGGRS